MKEKIELEAIRMYAEHCRRYNVEPFDFSTLPSQTKTLFRNRAKRRLAGPRNPPVK